MESGEQGFPEGSDLIAFNVMNPECERRQLETEEQDRGGKGSIQGKRIQKEEPDRREVAVELSGNKTILYGYSVGERDGQRRA